MKIIAGLGNPGAQYAGNRHNIGFMAVDALQRLPSFSPWARKFKAEISEGEIGGEKVLLMKPLTYMNLSGESVGEAMRFFKLAPADIIVIHDELDLLAGRARIKTGGGHGGHNGLKSIDAHCGKEYRRLRLGIGHPGDKERVHGHVLGDFAKTDRVWLDPLLDAIADNAAMLVKSEDSQLMNKLALATGSKPETEKPAKAAKPAAQSHIHQARNNAQPKKLPETGPMAEMLKRMFGKKD
ncbi:MULTISPECIES: aminoacyl-tRNA hydrolase [Rhizobium/Agrobacterium group]|jgi:PTH1 family peptidyl-tRNA hydrolase|uniref:Peptidyl-tRNA hydrolase n=2 Tax=Rhizobium/Agrobacterium group TaxID=227290 RepID=A0A1B9UUU1_AGRTU|nr:MULTISPECIES: aminoacyl-tRNA hydrolase [Rhizobium/Agrobacterium group]AHK02051.1 peptidyl-tRNA hydrolase [Agrobacterium tumefaciens LBA4213 (Ach5)]AKC07882.1 peptidyl tRNA hydrolase [Agrobacterium tumefaciens]EHJ98682.1 peptidyl-tRNA hydrolase [Agrobacterium tumefaciens 5A]MDP9560922.1 PTH1 family peptidyl-tRNA hydrolase [Rhizobium nepotum]QDG91241.1 aminoacyl-tRNA hydrolase [Rhizobium sp. NIBRBAC000502774]HCV72851.1 aminoacyl-tRNA hydrolase [Agrobacterium sp.]